MLHHYQAKSLDDIYLDDIPYIIHPEKAMQDLADTALPNRVIPQWNLPQGYTLFVSQYHKFHHQSPWLAYRDALADIRSGKVVLLRKDRTDYTGCSVLASPDHLRSDLPMFLNIRLHYVMLRKLKRPGYSVGSAEPAQHAQVIKTINTKAAGRLLAAGGVYNGNIEGFRQAAEQLGSEATAGYDEVLNETTAGLFIAASSILLVRNPRATTELTSYLGKYKKNHVLLKEIKVEEINYTRRDRAEYYALRKEFSNKIRPAFLKTLPEHPEAVSTFDSNDLKRLANGRVPSGWEVHHKIPLDDSGTNSMDNLILMKQSPYHSALTKTQGIIQKDLPYNGTTKILWPSPKGVVYPKGK